MIDGVSIRLSEATESSVRVTLAASEGASLGGDWELYGPQCEYARTLASTFRGRLTKEGNIEFLVTEPCYWSAELPFLYELRRTDLVGSVKHSLGLRQLAAHGANFRLDGRRIVIRGVMSDALDESSIRDAHAAEATLLVPAQEATLAMLSIASQLGTLVLLDGAALKRDLLAELVPLSWLPAVGGVLLREEQLQAAALDARTGGPLLGQWFDPNTDATADVVVPAASFLACSLPNDARPPGSLAASAKPLIAIRTAPSHAGIEQARAAADRLQADLAPEFNLAGYFARRLS